MYCKPCLDVFCRSDTGLGEKKSFPHHQTAEAVCRSYKQGCDICGRLWTQLMNHPDRPFGDRRWYALSTVCVFEQTRDEVETEHGRDISDPYTQKLYSTSLRYRVDFLWKNVGQSWSVPPPSIKFQLLAAQSTGSPRLELSSHQLRLH